MKVLPFLCFLACAQVSAHVHGGSPGSESSGMNALLREIEGGGHARNFVQRWLFGDIPDVQIGSAKGPVTVDENGIKEQTFISPAFRLANGEISNKWLPIDWPEGHILLKAFTADVLHAGPNGEVPPVTPCCGGPYEAPRATSFLHHWTVNKWQLPPSLFNRIIKDGGWEYALTSDQGHLVLAAGAGNQAGANGPCWDSNLHIFFGIGNEVRGKPSKHVLGGPEEAYEFPDPYGIEFDADAMRKIGEFMVLNTHAIDLRNVTNRRSCTECECSHLHSHAPDNRTLGGLSCCHSTDFDGGKCPVSDDVVSSNQTYYIRYTIKWRDFDASSAKPLEVITFDASDNNTKWGDLAFLSGGFSQSHADAHNDPLTMTTINDPRSGDYLGYRSCHIEYYVPRCNQPEDQCIHKIHNSWEVPYPMDIVFVRSHFHAGAINMTTSTARGPVCTGHATYHDGFIVDISTCTLGSETQAAKLDMGDKLSVEVVYGQDELPHFGVMGMSFVYAHIPRPATNQADVLI